MSPSTATVHPSTGRRGIGSHLVPLMVARAGTTSASAVRTSDRVDHGQCAVRQHRPRPRSSQRTGLQPERWSFVMLADLTRRRVGSRPPTCRTATRCNLGRDRPRRDSRSAQPGVRRPLRLHAVECGDVGSSGWPAAAPPALAQPARARPRRAPSRRTSRAASTTPCRGDRQPRGLRRQGRHSARASPSRAGGRAAAASRWSGTATRASTGRRSTWTRRTRPARSASTSGPASGPTALDHYRLLESVGRVGPRPVDATSARSRVRSRSNSVGLVAWPTAPSAARTRRRRGRGRAPSARRTAPRPRPGP